MCPLNRTACALLAAIALLPSGIVVGQILPFDEQKPGDFGCREQCVYLRDNNEPFCWTECDSALGEPPSMEAPELRFRLEDFM